MKKLNCSLFLIFSVVLGLATSSAAGQSAKFAATYDRDVVMVDIRVDGDDGPTKDRAVVEMDLAKMHVPQSKEVLIGVSGVVNLVTFTQAKGKNKGGKTWTEEIEIAGGELIERVKALVAEGNVRELRIKARGG